MNSTDQKNPIITGPIRKNMLIYFFPIFLGNMFQQLYNTVDAVIVGKFVGTEALAAVGGSAGQFAGIVTWFLSGIAAGATVTAAQHYGANDLGAVRDDIHNGIVLSLIGSGFFVVTGILLCRPLFIAMKTPGELMQDSLLYIRIIFTGLPVSFLYNMGSGILRSLGDSRRPLIYLIVCSVANILLDLFFVIVIPLGVAGVAVATVLAQAISAVLVIRRLTRLDPAYRLRFSLLRVYPQVMKTQLRIGLPGGFQSALYGIANIIIQTSINTFGTAAMAANAAFTKIDAFYWQVNGSFGASATTFAGQNYGAGNMSRVKKTSNFALAADGAFSVLFTAALLVFSRPLLKIFLNDPDVIEIGVRLIRIIGPFYLFYTFIEIFADVLRGMGDVLVPTLITLGGICLVRVLWIFFIVPLRPALETVMAAFGVSWVITAVLFIIYFSAAWKKMMKKHAESSH